MLLDRAAQIAPVIRMLAIEDGKNTETPPLKKAIGAGMNIPRPDAAYENVLGKNTLVLSENADTDAIVAAYRAFRTENGVPAVVYAPDAGVLTVAETPEEAGYIGKTYCSAVSYDEGCTDAAVTAAPAVEKKTGKTCRKVAIVTGGAQGFGKGIAKALSGEGAYVVIADMNYDGAKATAAEFPGAIAVKANVSDEQSVKGNDKRNRPSLRRT